MNPPTRRSVFALSVILIFVTVWLPAHSSAAAAQMSPPDAIEQDATWTGIIEIRNEVCIRKATVHVEAGATIRFVSPGKARGSSIRLSGDLSRSASEKRPRLVLAGTPSRPITVETPDDSPPGFITSDLASGGSLVARHVVFRRLGSAAGGSRETPAVFLVLNSSGDDLWLNDCRLSDCGRIHAEFIGNGATAEIDGCTFARTIGPIAVEFIGTGDGLRVIRDNISDAAMHVECPQILLCNNVLVGRSAAVIVPARNARQILVTNNYVHNTTDRDDGRFALRCAAADAVVTENVLLGGTYVIEQAPRTVVGNVLVGADALRPQGGGAEPQTGGPAANTTHYLLSNPASQARISDNLFLGPAYAAISAGRESPQPRIENNLFDGWGAARRAIHFNMLLPPPRQKPLAAIVTGNVFTRYRSAPVVDAARHIGTLAHAGMNVFAEVSEGFYEGGDLQKAAAGDRLLRSFADLHLQAPVATRSALAAEEQLLQRQISVEQVRKMWFDAYRPLQGSPLLGTQPAGPRASSLPG